MHTRARKASRMQITHRWQEVTVYLIYPSARALVLDPGELCWGLAPVTVGSPAWPPGAAPKTCCSPGGPESRSPSPGRCLRHRDEPHTCTKPGSPLGTVCRLLLQGHSAPFERRMGGLVPPGREQGANTGAELPLGAPGRFSSWSFGQDLCQRGVCAALGASPTCP